MTNKNIKSALMALAITPALAFAQADMPPTNDLENPYLTQSGYFKMPAGRDWGSSSTVEIDAANASSRGTAVGLLNGVVPALAFWLRGVASPVGQDGQ